ncbi:MAG: hypothetical protein ACTHN0_04295 [Aquihabitans sp.]
MTRRRTPLAVGALLVLAASLAGCGLFGSDESASTTTTTPPTTTTTTEPPVAGTDPPELLDPGAEPRQPLRVAYTEGDEAVITFTSDLAITQETEGRTQRLDSPPITQTLTYTVGATTDAGSELTIHIDAIAAKGKGTDLSQEQLDALDDELAPLVGLEATAVATPLGELEDLAFDAPDGLSESLTAQLDALEEQLPTIGPALPSEPVGVGASWRTTSTANVGGAEVQTTSTVKVTGIDGGLLSYTSAIETSAEPQDLAFDGLGKGTTATLRSSDLKGTATGSMGLDRVALTLRTRLEGAQEITLTSDGTDTALRQSLEVAYAAATDAA